MPEGTRTPPRVHPGRSADLRSGDPVASQDFLPDLESPTWDDLIAEGEDDA